MRVGGCVIFFSSAYALYCMLNVLMSVLLLFMFVDGAVVSLAFVLVLCVGLLFVALWLCVRCCCDLRLGLVMLTLVPMMRVLLLDVVLLVVYAILLLIVLFYLLAMLLLLMILMLVLLVLWLMVVLTCHGVAVVVIVAYDVFFCLCVFFFDRYVVICVAVGCVDVAVVVGVVGMIDVGVLRC